MGILEFIYYLGYKIDKCVKSRRARKLPFPVISVGNITVGGTGKTPVVMAIAKEALRRGFMPCILTRGYKGSAKGPCYVSRGDGPLLDAQAGGDEPVLMAKKLRGVPIVKCSDRYEAGMFALDMLRTAERLVFILDDGFQHWRLKKDKDILLMDAAYPLHDEKLLPVGRLREPLFEIKRADMILITKAMQINHSFEGLIKKYNPSASIFYCNHMPDKFYNKSGLEVEPEKLKNANVYAFCGLGNPDSFRKSLEALGANIIGFRAFPDHHKYGGKDIKNIETDAKGADWIITTEKDIIRLEKHNTPENLISMGIEVMVSEGFYDEVFDFHLKDDINN